MSGYIYAPQAGILKGSSATHPIGVGHKLSDGSLIADLGIVADVDLPDYGWYFAPDNSKVTPVSDWLVESIMPTYHTEGGSWTFEYSYRALTADEMIRKVKDGIQKWMDTQVKAQPHDYDNVNTMEKYRAFDVNNAAHTVGLTSDEITICSKFKTEADAVCPWVSRVWAKAATIENAILAAQMAMPESIAAFTALLPALVRPE
jgi:hypothetical protein